MTNGEGKGCSEGWVRVTATRIKRVRRRGDSKGLGVIHSVKGMTFLFSSSSTINTQSVFHYEACSGGGGCVFGVIWRCCAEKSSETTVFCPSSSFTFALRFFHCYFSYLSAIGFSAGWFRVMLATRFSLFFNVLCLCSCSRVCADVCLRMCVCSYVCVCVLLFFATVVLSLSLSPLCTDILGVDCTTGGKRGAGRASQQHVGGGPPRIYLRTVCVCVCVFLYFSSRLFSRLFVTLYSFPFTYLSLFLSLSRILSPFSPSVSFFSGKKKAKNSSTRAF